MGFLQGLGRMIAGKPVFSAEDTRTSTSENAPTSSSALTDGRGRKNIPEIAVTHLKPYINGANLEVWVNIENASDMTIYLDKIHFLGQKTELDRELTAGQFHQYRVYRGPSLANKPNDDASVVYRIQSNGDLFQAEFRVEFGYQYGHYTPEEFHLEHPIRDI
jgi:hypothetical protein